METKEIEQVKKEGSSSSEPSVGSSLERTAVSSNLEREPSVGSSTSLERFIIFPIQHKEIYDLFEKQLESFWVHKEVDFKSDREDFESFKPNEQKMLKHVLAFFAASDAIVNENIITRFMVEVPFPESKLFYPGQMQMETIHTVTYALAIQECIRDKAEQNKLFRAVLGMEGVKRKSQWAVDYMESKEKTLAARLAAFVIVEGIFFQGAFAVIFWVKKMYPGKLSAVTFSNELISADERLHTDHGVLVYRLLPKEQQLSQVEINKIFQSAMEVERFFIKEFLEEGVLGLSQQNMIEFIEYMCDFWLLELGYDKLFGTANPLTYMDMLSLKPRTNFFERRNREYRRGKSVDAVIQTKSFQGNVLDF